MWGVVGFLFFFLGLPAGVHADSGAARPHCEKPWVFFDLGETLLDTHERSKTDAESQEPKIRYLPLAADYLRQLRKQGYKIGLIVNIPENWGKDRPSKVAALKKFVDEHWTGDRPMDWSFFADRILVPPTDAERKPSPFLFQEALKLAEHDGCKAIFQGETPREVAVANQVGLNGFEVGRPGRFYLPFSELNPR